MMPRIILMILLKKITAILSVLVLIFFMAGCGGGGGGGDEGGGGGTERVTISGTADDGTLNSPISGAECAFVDLNGDRLFGTTADNFGDSASKCPRMWKVISGVPRQICRNSSFPLSQIQKAWHRRQDLR